MCVTAAHEAVRVAANEPPGADLAVEPLWNHCLYAGAAGANGTTLRATGNALDAQGQPTAAAWPYNPTLGAGTETAPASAHTDPWYLATLVDVPLAHDGIEDNIELVLANSCPVVVVVELTDEFENPDPAGEIAVPALTSPVGDFHSVLAVGVATKPGGDRRLLVQNSWGPGWGAGGFGWLPLDYLVSFADEAALVDPTTLRTLT